MNKTLLLWLNTLSLIFMLTMNGLAGAGDFFGKSVGEVSRMNETLITPAGYAFSIWSFIFIGLIVYVVAQWVYRNTERANESLIPGGIWFTVTNLANGFWVLAFVHERYILSVVLMLILLFGLTKLVIKLRLEIWDAPVRLMATVWWPLTFYYGWIIAATIVNISATLVALNWSAFGIDETIWSVVMMAIATALYIFLIYNRCLRESAAAGIWALIAIYVKYENMDLTVSRTALICAIIIGVASSYHAWLNRKTLPGVRKTPPSYQ